MKKNKKTKTVFEPTSTQLQSRRAPETVLLAYLRSMISSGRFQQGTRLPSLRQLAEEFDLAVTRVQRCLVELEKDGFVERVHGSGVFVRPPKRQTIGRGRHRIAVLLERNPAVPETYSSYVFQGVQERAADADCLLEIDYRFTPDRQLLLETAERNDALLLMGSHYDLNFQSLRLFRPVIGVELSEFYEDSCSLLSLDPFSAAALAVAYFRKRRLKEAVIVQPTNALHLERADAFRGRWERFGGSRTVPLGPELLPRLESSKTAVFFTGGDYYQEAAGLYAEATGKQLRRQKNLLYLDGKNRLVPDREPGVTIAPDWVEVGRAALDETLRRLEQPGSPPRRISLPCQLTE